MKLETEVGVRNPVITLNHQIDSPSWDAFVKAHPHGTPFHLVSWQNTILNTFGHLPQHIVARDEKGAVVGVLPLFLVRSRLFGRMLVSTPQAAYGGILSNSESKLAFVSPTSLDKFRAVCDRLGRQIPVVSLLPISHPNGYARYEDWASTPTPPEFDAAPPTAKAADLATLLYTSGTTGTGTTGTIRPNPTGAPIYAAPAGLHLNPAAYSAPLTGQWGTAGRNSITGPSQFSLDSSINRTFRPSGRFFLDLKVSATNMLNHPVFTDWNTTVNSTQFGLPVNTNAMRSVETQLRLRF